MSLNNSEFEKPKKISASKYAFLSKKVRNLSFDQATGNCDVATVRRPSLPFVFYKEKRDKTEFLGFSLRFKP